MVGLVEETIAIEAEVDSEEEGAQVGRGRGCFICNSQNHLMRECPGAYKEKKGPRFGKCYECGGPHFARECLKSNDRGSGQQQNSKGQVNAISGYSSDLEESL